MKAPRMNTHNGLCNHIGTHECILTMRSDTSRKTRRTANGQSREFRQNQTPQQRSTCQETIYLTTLLSKGLHIPEKMQKLES
jgi:hypothetical protein